MKRIALILVMLLLLSGCRMAAMPAEYTPFPSPVATPRRTPFHTTLPTPTPKLTPPPRPTLTPVPVESKIPVELINRAELTTPVLINGFFVGGLYRGEWMMFDDFYNTGAVEFEGFLYDVYRDGRQIGKAFGELPHHCLYGDILEGDEYIYGFDGINLHDENYKGVAYDIALDADWELFPRGYVNQSPDQAEYQAHVENLLKLGGLENPNTTLKQVISVDLDGDGIDEMLFTADNTVDYEFERAKKGDNALLAFRKIVDGKPVDQAVDCFIYFEKPEYDTLYRILFYVDSFADLDADGTLEVIVRCWYYEGIFWEVYKLVENRLVRVASNGVGL